MKTLCCRVSIISAFAICASSIAYGQLSTPFYEIEATPLQIVTTEGAVIELETVVVESAQDKARGLMHLRWLPANSSMLFKYEAPQIMNFWMKNTHIPLDIWFADASGKIVDIVYDMKPLSEERVPSAAKASIAIEVNAGLTRLLGITIGAVVRHAVITGTVRDAR